MLIIVAILLFLTGDCEQHLLRHNEKDLTRERILDEERGHFIGNDIKLNSNETLVNNFLMKLKTQLYFTPNYYLSNHFLQTQAKIDTEPLYKLIRKMPKGADLHLHIAAVGDHDWIITNLTYRNNLYICDGPNDFLAFRWSNTPNIVTSCSADGGWKSVVSQRTLSQNASKYDNALKERLHLTYQDIVQSGTNQSEIWRRFLTKFDILKGIYTCAEIFPEFLIAFWDNFFKTDNVQYTELRISYKFNLYSINGAIVNTTDTFKLFQKINNAYAAANPDFIPARIILHDQRTSTPEQVAASIAISKDLISQFPDLIIGYDLVGQEDTGNPLTYYMQQLKSVSNSMDFYFHAGETDWEGTQVDRNLIDAVLLKTKRIGHGYAVPKHPWVMKEIEKRGIAIELSPISNQVLGLVSDFRNHPGSVMLANNLPVVICSDDPSFWNSVPLSYDFFIIFVVFGGADTDMRTLKKLAQNSIKHTGLRDRERKQFQKLWEAKWTKFINSVIFENKLRSQ